MTLLSEGVGTTDASPRGIHPQPYEQNLMCPQNWVVDAFVVLTPTHDGYTQHMCWILRHASLVRWMHPTRVMDTPKPRIHTSRNTSMPNPGNPTPTVACRAEPRRARWRHRRRGQGDRVHVRTVQAGGWGNPPEGRHLEPYHDPIKYRTE